MDNSSGQLQYTLANTPLYGNLTLNGVAIGVGATFTQFDLDNNRLAYTHGGSENFSDGFNVTLVDGSGGTIGNTRFALTISNVNDAPLLQRNLPLTVAEGGSGVLDSSFLLVNDAEQGAIDLRYRLTLLPSHGTLSLNGVTLAANSVFTQADLNNQLLSYRHDGGETLNDLFKWVLDDGLGGSIGESISQLLITPVNDAPQMVSTAQPVTYTENDPAVVIDGTLLVSDVDNATFQGATVAIVSGFHAGEDLLSFTPVGGIAGSWDAASGVLTLSGAGSLADYHAALRSVTYQVTAAAQENPTAGARLLRMSISDGALTSNTVSNTVTVVPVNDRPVVVAGGVLAYTEGDAARVLDGNILLTDPDSAYMEGAVLTASGGYVANQDQLTFVDHWGIASQWDAVTGTLTLSGHAALADYQSALRSITYWNGNGDIPTAGSRTWSVVVQDGSHTSLAATSQVTVTAINDAPVLTAPDFRSVAEDEPLLLAGLSLQDADVGTGLLKITLLTDHGQITLGSTSNLQFLLGGDGRGSMVFTGQLAAVQAALNGLIYQGVADFNGVDTLTLQVSDQGNAGSGPLGLDERSVIILVQPVADPPVAGVDAFMTPEDAPLLISTAQLLANDVDVDGNSLTASVSLNVYHGTLTDLGNGLLRYVPNQDYNGLDTFIYTVLDGRGGSALGRVTLIVNPIEDALQANNDRLVMDEDGSPPRFSVLANDRDPDQTGRLTVIGFTQAAHGNLIYHDDGTFSYQPEANYFGVDQFTYVINTGDARIGRATVNIVVNPVNDLPVLQTNATLQVEQGRSTILGGDLLRAVDLEQGPEDIVFTILALPANGEVIMDGHALGLGGSFTQADLDGKRVSYKHNGSRTTQDAFKFSLSDRVSSGVLRVGTFHLSIERAYEGTESTPSVLAQRPVVLPEVVIPKRFLVPLLDGVEREWGSRLTIAGEEWSDSMLTRRFSWRESAPILTVFHHGEYTVELEDSGTPLLTAVTNCNPGVADGSMVTPVLNAVRRSVASVAPGGLQTPLLTAVMAENSRGGSPVLGGGAGDVGVCPSFRLVLFRAGI
ncbi:MAG: Ig-like domain-containing protein [Magnetococcus sp. XQGC-1]